MARRMPQFAAIVIITILADLASAQKSAKPAAEEAGMTAYVQFGGTANSDGAVYELNSNFGYDFNSHFGFALGAPIYFIRPAASTGANSASGFGDPYLGVHLTSSV